MFPFSFMMKVVVTLNRTISSVYFTTSATVLLDISKFMIQIGFMLGRDLRFIPPTSKGFFPKNNLRH